MTSLLNGPPGTLTGSITWCFARVSVVQSFKLSGINIGRPIYGFRDSGKKDSVHGFEEHWKMLHCRSCVRQLLWFRGCRGLVGDVQFTVECGYTLCLVSTLYVVPLECVEHCRDTGSGFEVAKDKPCSSFFVPFVGGSNPILLGSWVPWWICVLKIGLYNGLVRFSFTACVEIPLEEIEHSGSFTCINTWLQIPFQVVLVLDS